MKNRYPGFIFKNPGTRVGFRVFKNVPNWQILAEKLAKLVLFGQKSMQISMEIAKLVLFGLQNGDYYDFLEISVYLHMYVPMLITIFKESISSNVVCNLLKYIYPHNL